MPRPVLQRLGQVGGCNRLFSGQIGNGARELEHPVKCPRRQMQLPHRLAYQLVNEVLSPETAAGLFMMFHGMCRNPDFSRRYYE
jgi:hypothetical protein